MGDIALPSDESVTSRARLLVEEGLKRKGYAISTDPRSANVVAVSSKGFLSMDDTRRYCAHFRSYGVLLDFRNQFHWDL